MDHEVPGDGVANEAALATEEFWDKKAELSKGNVTQATMFEDPWVNRCIERAQLPIVKRGIKASAKSLGDNAETVLDLGCGVGRWVPLLKSYYSHYHGVEISESMLLLARKQFPEHQFSKLENMTLPIKDESVDFALSIAVLHHNSYENQDWLLKELFRVIRPGGELLIFESHGHRTESEISTYYPRSPDDWIDAVQSNGFHLLTKTGTAYHLVSSVLARLVGSGEWFRSPFGHASLWFDSYVTPAISPFLPERFYTRLSMRFKKRNALDNS